tara:strand:- start:438 stop:710 length:273 start_codon:yes stop_codon:yes gene_type:complete
MTLNEIIKIQSVIDNRAIASDTYQTLNGQYYFSKSKNKKIKLGDMHIDHFLRAIKVSNKDVDLIDFETQEVIEQQKKTLKKIKRLLNDNL